MGKNLKRQNEGGVLGTPGGASRHGGKPPMSVGGKRHKQMSLVPFLRTPAHVEETPALQAKSGKADISSTGLQKLGQLNLRTQQKQQQNTSTVAPTQGRPAAPAEPRWQESSPDDDDFVISMSQTYERTQPEPCVDYGSAEHDEVELSLRRTQQYCAATGTGPTQRYNQHQEHHHHHHHHNSQHQHQHHFLINAAAAALDQAQIHAAAATTTNEEWETSVAKASAFGAEATNAAVLLPPDGGFLEGQGSSQPGGLLRILAAATAAVDTADGTLFGGINFSLPQRLQPALPVMSGGGGPAQTPELEIGGSSGCGGGPAQTPELQIGGGGAGRGCSGGGAGCGGGGTGSACTVVPEDIADDGTTPPLQVGLPLFPIFTQSRARRRPIHLIRHGESEYNVACRRRGGFGDPNDIFDARLTSTGEKQARGLRPQLLDLIQQHGDPLFIVSPLSRAIETFLLMLPDPGRLHITSETPPPVGAAPGARPGAGGAAGPGVGHTPQVARMAGAGGSAAGSGATSASGLESKPLNVVICPFLAEFLLTTGDIGRPRSVLIESYPQIAEPLRKGLDTERWWYENMSRGPNCALKKTLNSTEPDKAAKARVDRFRQFVFSQPHRPIVVVGHANFFKSLTHDSHYMGNCQMMAWAP